MYRVRKACAESLVEVSRVVAMDVRRGALVNVFKGLLEDNSKFVRNAAMQHLGQFIHTLVDVEGEEGEKKEQEPIPR